MIAKKLLTPEEVAYQLGVSKQTLNSWRCSGRYPLRFCRIGRLIRYEREAVDQFIRDNTVGGETDDEESRR